MYCRVVPETQLPSRAAITDDEGFELVMARRQRRHILVSERIRQQLGEIEAMNDDFSDTSSEGNFTFNTYILPVLLTW